MAQTTHKRPIDMPFADSCHPAKSEATSALQFTCAQSGPQCVGVVTQESGQ